MRNSGAQAWPWLADMWASRCVPDAEPPVWVAGEGDLDLRDGPEAEIIWLDGFTLADLLAGLHLTTPGAWPKAEGDGTVSFRNARGGRVRVDGALRHCGATLRFAGAGRFAFLW